MKIKIAFAIVGIVLLALIRVAMKKSLTGLPEEEKKDISVEKKHQELLKLNKKTDPNRK